MEADQGRCGQLQTDLEDKTMMEYIKKLQRNYWWRTLVQEVQSTLGYSAMLKNE